MSYIRKPSIMEQLFGADVPLWKKLLTLATFPVWGLVAAVVASCLAFLWAVTICIGVVIDNISDK